MRLWMVLGCGPSYIRDYGKGRCEAMGGSGLWTKLYWRLWEVRCEATGGPGLWSKLYWRLWEVRCEATSGPGVWSKLSWRLWR